MKNTLKKKHVNSSEKKITNFHLLNIQLRLCRSRKWASSTTASSSLFRFENNSFIGNIRRVYVSRVLLLIVVMIATKPRNLQRPTISSYLLGYPPSLAKLRKATDFNLVPRALFPAPPPELGKSALGTRLLPFAFGLPYLLIELFYKVCLWCRRTVARSVYGHMITKFSRMGRLPHFLSYGPPPTRGASRLFILTCDVFGTGKTNILALCYLFGKTYKPAHSSAPQVTEINKLDQITETAIHMSTHIPLKALMIHLKRVKLRGVVY